MALNAWGDVVGFATLPGHRSPTSVPRPFLWTRRNGISPLPLLDGDDNGQALGINVWRQVVGVSCAGGSCRGVLWQGGKVIDLSSHVLTGLNGTITNVGDIDDLGRSAGSSSTPAPARPPRSGQSPPVPSSITGCTGTSRERTESPVFTRAVGGRWSSSGSTTVPPGPRSGPTGRGSRRIWRRTSSARAGWDTARPSGVSHPCLGPLAVDRARGSRRPRPVCSETWPWSMPGPPSEGDRPGHGRYTDICAGPPGRAVAGNRRARDPLLSLDGRRRCAAPQASPGAGG